MADDYIEGVIKAVVTRCTTSAQVEVLKRWDRLDAADLRGEDMRGTKAKVCETLQRIAKRDQFTREIAGDLELAYMQLNSSKKFWKVFKLKGANLKHALDARTLRSKLVHSLQIKKTDGIVDGNLSYFAGALWLRLHFHTVVRRRRSSNSSNKRSAQQKSAYDHSSSVFLLTFPGSPIFIMSRAGVRNSRLVLQAFTETMGAERVVDTHLSGQHVASLADMALRTQKQPADKYRQMEKKENPLADKVSKKRKAAGDRKPGFEDTADIADDDVRQEKRQRRDVLARVFGAGPQPVLEKLEYKFDVKYPAPGGEGSTVSKCRAMVEIKGKHVLGGLSELGRGGYIKFPLPRHLTSVVSMSQNSFSITDKT